LGKVRPERVKKIARELVSRFPDRFTADFEANKIAVEALIETSSSKLRNRIAGYITRLVSISEAAKGVEQEEKESERAPSMGEESI